MKKAVIVAFVVNVIVLLLSIRWMISSNFEHEPIIQSIVYFGTAIGFFLENRFLGNQNPPPGTTISGHTVTIEKVITVNDHGTYNEINYNRPSTLFIGGFAALLLVFAFNTYKLAVKRFWADQTLTLNVNVFNNSDNPNFHYDGGIGILYYGQKPDEKEFKQKYTFVEIPPKYKDSTIRFTYLAKGFVVVDTMVYLPIINNNLNIYLKPNDELATVKGRVKNGSQEYLDNVSISLLDTVVYTNNSGRFNLNIPESKQSSSIRIIAEKAGYNTWDNFTPVIKGEEIEIILIRK